MTLGDRGKIIFPIPENAHRLKLITPVLNETELDLIKSSEFKTITLSTTFDLTGGPSGLETALKTLCENAAQGVEDGAKILILSDRMNSLQENTSYIPPLLAVGSVHHHLIKAGLRLKASIIADTAQWENIT